jgi:tetratricopeptide (TPR) repeat protein
MTKNYIQLKKDLTILKFLYAIGILLIVGCVSTAKPVYTGRTMHIPLQTSPEGARVIFDGKQEGFTPMTLKFTYLIDPQGVHNDEKQERKIKIEKEGYKPYVLSFSFQGKEYKKIPRPILLKKLDDAVSHDDGEKKIHEQKKLNKEVKGVLKGTEKDVASLRGKNDTQKIAHHDKTIETLSAEEWFEKGLALGKAKKYKEEIKAYKQAIKLKPDYANAHYNLGLTYLILNDNDSAIEEFRILKALKPQSVDNLYESTVLRASLDKVKKQKADDQNASQIIYTIQTGSFIEIERARKEFESIHQGLNEKELNYLRIEKVGGFYSVRLGKFEDYASADIFLKTVMTELSPTAIILKAHIKGNRIMKLHKK